MTTIVPSVMVAIVALGMALAFISADYRSPTSRALALTLVFIGLAIASNVGFLFRMTPGSVMPGWLAVPEAAALFAVLEFVLRVRRTLPAGELDVRVGDYVLRIGQFAAVMYCVLS